MKIGDLTTVVAETLADLEPELFPDGLNTIQTQQEQVILPPSQWSDKNKKPTQAENLKLLNRYDWDNEDKPDMQKWFNLVRIVVKTEEDKEQLIRASYYLHNLEDIDTDIMAVGFLAHLYQMPNLIEVEDEK